MATYQEQIEEAQKLREARKDLTVKTLQNDAIGVSEALSILNRAGGFYRKPEDVVGSREWRAKKNKEWASFF